MFLFSKLSRQSLGLTQPPGPPLSFSSSFAVDSGISLPEYDADHFPIYIHAVQLYVHFI